MSAECHSAPESGLVQLAPVQRSWPPGPAATRILLIDPTDPWITNNKLLKHHDQVMLPIGLMYLSAYLKQHLLGRTEIKIVSTIVDAPSPGDLEALMRDFQPEIVGVRCVIFYAEQIQRIVDLAREILPDAMIVAGGPNVTFDNYNLQSNPSIDILGKAKEKTHSAKSSSALIARASKGFSSYFRGWMESSSAATGRS